MRLSLSVIQLGLLSLSMLHVVSVGAQSQSTELNSTAASNDQAAVDSKVPPSLEQVLGAIELKKNTDERSQKRVRQGNQNNPGLNTNNDAQSGLVADIEPSGEHSLTSLAAEAGDFVRGEHSEAERVEVNVTPVDRRLRLKRCDEDVVYSWTSASNTMGNTTVTAKCNGSAPWKVLVRVQASVFLSIPVLTVPVNKDDILSADIVSMRQLDISALRRETIRSIDKVLGYRFKRRLAAGREISSAILAAPKVVVKGDTVLISASNQLIDVQMKGTALAGGEMGKKIQVRSNSSGRVIQTWIKGPGEVVVSP